MEEQSDTPRTDAAFEAVDQDCKSQFEWDGWKFARQLERALATATRERNEARADVSALVNGNALTNAAFTKTLKERDEARAEAEAEPVAWRKPDGAICTDAYMASCWKDKGPVEPLYTHPPSDAWRPASEPPSDSREVLVWMPTTPGAGVGAIGRHANLAWHPHYVGSPVTHWRDIEPPEESK